MRSSSRRATSAISIAGSKQARLAYEQRVVVSIVGSGRLHRIIDEHRGWLADQVLATEIIADPISQPLAANQIDVGDERVSIALA